MRICLGIRHKNMYEKPAIAETELYQQTRVAPGQILIRISMLGDAGTDFYIGSCITFRGKATWVERVSLLASPGEQRAEAVSQQTRGDQNKEPGSHSPLHPASFKCCAGCIMHGLPYY